MIIGNLSSHLRGIDLEVADAKGFEEEPKRLEILVERIGLQAKSRDGDRRIDEVALRT